MASNGNQEVQLPPAREAVIEQAQRIHQEVSHERDMLIREVGQLKTDIAGYKVGIEAQASQLAQMESRVMEMTIVRDNAVGRRAELEILVQNVQTLLNTFMSGHKTIIETPCVYEARNRDGSMGGSEAWCQTHGWDCPNAARGK